jgi:hypothetical protein
MAKSKSIAPKAASAVAVPSKLAAKMAAAAGKGFEEATRDAFAIPFLRILQDLSPQVKKKMAGYIEGAKPGQFLNTVSQQVSNHLRVVPCYYTQTFIEWTPRDEKEGQGLVAVHAPGAPIIATATRIKGRNTLPNGNILMDTRSHFVLVVNPDGSTEGALIALASTGIKVSRRWMSQMKSSTIERSDGSLIPAPMFAYSYALTTEEEANEQGSWYQWVVGDKALVTDEHVFDAAMLFGEQMKTGAAKVNYAEAAPAHAAQPETPADLDNEIDA